MPIYEYYCADCQRKVSIFFRSFSAAENATTLACPRCSGPHLSRRLSRVRVLKGGSRKSAPDDATGDDMGGLGGDDEDMGDMGEMMGGMGGMEQMLAGVDENDPRSIARWARRMQAESGEVDPEMDEALTRIERGEDPDKVLEGFEEADAPTDEFDM